MLRQVMRKPSMIKRLCRRSVLALAALSLLAPVASAAAVQQLQSLTTEHQIQPLAIDVASPRFAWVVTDAPRGTKPLAYRIEVARSMAALTNDHADVWDSGHVTSRESFGIAYAGPALSPSTRYYWKVIAQTSTGEASATSWFETAPSSQEWSHAAWIGKPAGGSL